LVSPQQKRVSPWIDPFPYPGTKTELGFGFYASELTFPFHFQPLPIVFACAGLGRPKFFDFSNSANIAPFEKIPSVKNSPWPVP
jgi:hypothetical protein